MRVCKENSRIINKLMLFLFNKSLWVLQLAFLAIVMLKYLRTYQTGMTIMIEVYEK